MKQRSHRKLGAILGYIAISLGVITLGLWLFLDAGNISTAVGAFTTIMVGALVVVMSRRSSSSKNS